MKPLPYFGTAALSLLAAALMAGCASWREPPPSDLSPRSLEDVRRSPAESTGQPKVALALGGGGLRGFAHLGVLTALEEAGIRPDIVVGTSAGAVVGAAYASGKSPAEIEAIARSVKLSSLVDFAFSKSGLMRGDNIANWVNTLTGDVPIEHFPRRFAAVATDLDTGRAVLLDRGPAGPAVRASAAVPGAHVPVAYGGGHLVDGGVASLVPVRFARALGADVVIAVDVYCSGPGSDGLAAPSVLMRTLRVQSCLVAQAEMAEADVLIAPQVRVSGMSAKGEQEGAIQAGYDAAVAALARHPATLAATGPAARRVTSASW